jgi:hypothetical protein
MLAMPKTNQHRNFLFGLLALQVGLVGRDALIAAMNAWVQDKSKAIEQILLEQKALTADTHALVAALVEKHLSLHGGGRREEPPRTISISFATSPASKRFSKTPASEKDGRTRFQGRRACKCYDVRDAAV